MKECKTCLMLSVELVHMVYSGQIAEAIEVAEKLLIVLKQQKD